jgi:hypothetical protein
MSDLLELRPRGVLRRRDQTAVALLRREPQLDRLRLRAYFRLPFEAQLLPYQLTK